MNYDEETVDKLAANYELLCNIIRQSSPDERQTKVDLSRIESMIQKEIPDTLKEDAPEDFYGLYMDFKSMYEKFRDFILYDKLIGKNIVALGGGFSSGKSSFLNALMRKNVLPASIDPSTSVPTYILHGEKHDVLGMNVFDAAVPMQPRDIRKIAHGFGELEDENEEKVSDSVSLGHVLDNIFFSTPLHSYENIAFLDTPGYSKPDSELYSAKTDEQIARGQLNSSNYILWFVQADAGTITEDDMKFIKTLREDIPRLIIVNKADRKNICDLKEICARIRSTLDLKGIAYMDVCVFSSRMEQIADEDLKEYIETDREKIKTYINIWNQQVYESGFAKNFKILFTRCRDYYEDKLSEDRRRMGRMNEMLTRCQQKEDQQILESLINDFRRRIEHTKQVREKLLELQHSFFTEIKTVADQVGIDMPEPSQMDLVEKKTVKLYELLDFQYAGSVFEEWMEECIADGSKTKTDFGGIYYEDRILKLMEEA